MKISLEQFVIPYFFLSRVIFSSFKMNINQFLCFIFNMTENFDQMSQCEVEGIFERKRKIPLKPQHPCGAQTIQTMYKMIKFFQVYILRSFKQSFSQIFSSSSPSGVLPG